MYTLNSRERELLRSIGMNVQGPHLIELLKNIREAAGDVSSITGDYAAQVEGRKLVKEVVTLLMDGLTIKRNGFGIHEVELDENYS